MQSSIKYLYFFYFTLSVLFTFGQGNSTLLNQSQKFSVRGSVIESDTREPIQNVNIEVNGGAYTTTDVFGEFRILVSRGDELTIRHKDFETVFYTIQSDERIKVEVEPSEEEQEQQMIGIFQLLNIDLEKNFSILDYNGRYTRKFFSAHEVEKIKHYQLIVNDGKMLGEVYQALDQCDISNISIIKTSHTKLEKFRRETKIKALKKAKEKALEYVNAIGQTIGKAIFIKEIENQNYPSTNHENLNEVIVIDSV